MRDLWIILKIQRLPIGSAVILFAAIRSLSTWSLSHAL